MNFNPTVVQQSPDNMHTHWQKTFVVTQERPGVGLICTSAALKLETLVLIPLDMADLN